MEWDPCRIILILLVLYQIELGMWETLRFLVHDIEFMFIIQLELYSWIEGKT